MEELQAENAELRLQVAGLKKHVIEQRIKLIALEAQINIAKLDPALRQVEAELAALQTEKKIVSQPE